MPYTGLRKDAERRRMRAMTLLDQGRLLQAEVARQLGVTPSAVSQWVKARNQGGEEALRAKPHPGPRPKLNARQLQPAVAGRSCFSVDRAHRAIRPNCGR